MSTGDNYEYEKSNIHQDIDAYSPYVEKQQSNFVNDPNNSVYANSSLSLVQFDLGQIFNSSSVSDTGDMYLVIPITMVAACRTATGVVATPRPVPGAPPVLRRRVHALPVSRVYMPSLPFASLCSRAVDQPHHARAPARPPEHHGVHPALAAPALYTLSRQPQRLHRVHLTRPAPVLYTHPSGRPAAPSCLPHRT